MINEIESGFKRIVQAEKVLKYLGINLKHENNFYKLDQKHYIDKTINDIFKSTIIKDSKIPMIIIVCYQNWEKFVI